MTIDLSQKHALEDGTAIWLQRRPDGWRWRVPDTALHHWHHVAYATPELALAGATYALEGLRDNAARIWR